MMTVIVEMPSPRKVFDAGTTKWAEKAFQKLPREPDLLPPYVDSAVLHLMSRMEESALFLERIDRYCKGLNMNNGRRKMRTLVFDDFIDSYVVIRGRIIKAANGLPDWFRFAQMCVIEDGP
jgi:hypothetical protein